MSTVRRGGKSFRLTSDAVHAIHVLEIVSSKLAHALITSLQSLEIPSAESQRLKLISGGLFNLFHEQRKVPYAM